MIDNSDGNRIGDRGCKYLSAAHLNSIIELDLGNSHLIQAQIILEALEWLIYQKQAGNR
jgi:hypothetical protein